LYTGITTLIPVTVARPAVSAPGLVLVLLLVLLLMLLLVLLLVLLVVWVFALAVIAHLPFAITKARGVHHA
jgi:hypothetical protein